jgi:hypothetical protein
MRENSVKQNKNMQFIPTAVVLVCIAGSNPAHGHRQTSIFSDVIDPAIITSLRTIHMSDILTQVQFWYARGQRVQSIWESVQAFNLSYNNNANYLVRAANFAGEKTISFSHCKPYSWISCQGVQFTDTYSTNNAIIIISKASKLVIFIPISTLPESPKPAHLKELTKCPL